MLSKLEAINRMLIALGSSPVNSIDGRVNRDVAACKSILERARSNILLEGWLFNTDVKVVMDPIADGRIKLPDDVLRVDLSPTVYQDTRQYDPVQRGEWLYNRVGHTYTWSRSLTVDIIRDLPWEELPEAARQYASAKAAEDAVTELEGDERQIEKARMETIKARRNAMSEEIGNSDYTIFNAESNYRIRTPRYRR